MKHFLKSIGHIWFISSILASICIITAAILMFVKFDNEEGWAILLNIACLSALLIVASIAVWLIYKIIYEIRHKKDSIE